MYLATILLAGSGWFLLTKADAQARDTVRKHHLEDVEKSLYFARNIHGTYPPYDEPSWCGILTASGNEKVREQVEKALRTQNEKYGNPDKPFPQDPLVQNLNFPGRKINQEKLPKQFGDYFYWKHSPASFELLAILEASPNGDRTTAFCADSPNFSYDYGLTSVWREN